MVNKKNILIISRSFYPIIAPRAFRATELVKEFSRQGHDVTIITMRNNNIHNDFEKKYKCKILDIGKIKFKSLPLKDGKFNLFSRIINRILLQLFEYPDIELMFRINKILSHLNKKYDLLISIAVPFPIHWGVALADPVRKGLTKIWVADCGDPYMFNPHDPFKKLPYFTGLEKFFCKKSDFISIPFDGLKDSFYPEFRKKIRIIPQGFNFEELELSKYIKNKIPTFAYAGGFIRTSRNPQPLLEILLSINVEFRFIIYGNNIELVKPFIKRLNDKIEIRDVIPRNELIYELSKMDFLINIGYNTINQMPSKIIDYALSKRPIFNIENSIPDLNTLMHFLEGNYAGQLEIKNIQKYNIQNVCHNFLQLNSNIIAE